MSNTISRKFRFDAGHRVMNHRSKCSWIHGHDYEGVITLRYKSEEEIGYAIDFAVIKQLFSEYIDQTFDHGFIANARDSKIIKLCYEEHWRLFIMPGKDTNPSVENIAKILFYAGKVLLEDKNLTMDKIILYETPNCFTECLGLSEQELKMFRESLFDHDLQVFKKEVEIPKYDKRKMSDEERASCPRGYVVGMSNYDETD